MAHSHKPHCSPVVPSVCCAMRLRHVEQEPVAPVKLLRELDARRLVQREYQWAPVCAQLLSQASEEGEREVDSHCLSCALMPSRADCHMSPVQT